MSKLDFSKSGPSLHTKDHDEVSNASNKTNQILSTCQKLSSTPNFCSVIAILVSLQHPQKKV